MTIKPWRRVIEISGWIHDPAKRSRRFRCQYCSKLIADGSDIVIEKRPGGAHGYHKEHFLGLYRDAALAREVEFNVKVREGTRTECSDDDVRAALGARP